MKTTNSIKKVLLTIVFASTIASLFSQQEIQEKSTVFEDNKQENSWRHSIGSSLFLLGNLDTKEPPKFLQFNYGYHFSSTDALIVEAITWAYYGPLGIQYWDSFDGSYPGKIRSFGMGIGYQHFYWKGLYSTVQATPFLQNFYDTQDEKIQSGFQLWCQFRIGYRIELFKRRWFIEPSVVINYWPINTNFPESFAQVEENWPNYFLFEPGLHFGFKF